MAIAIVLPALGQLPLLVWANVHSVALQELPRGVLVVEDLLLIERYRGELVVKLPQELRPRRLRLDTLSATLREHRAVG